MTTKSPKKHEFKAEVKQVLDIVVNSLYTDKEIFIRELVSNASDALEKLRHLQITEKNIFDDNLTLQVNVTTDDTANTITIQDFGIGMNEEELTENLGTIAHSGSKTFLDALKKEGTKNDNLIGQFGVGFYSVFMVADEVKVYSHRWKEEDQGYCWTSDGSGSYTIEESEGQRRGTKIVLKLKEEYKEFAQKTRVESILKQYSSFVAFPVQLNGEKVNTVEAIWLKNKSEITEEQYKEFYKFQSNAFGDPLAWMHFAADAPLVINALLYIPSENMERMGMGRIDPGTSLYCRKVLIEESPKELLPSWLRFVKGVVDSADIPLNISREGMQDSALVQKINTVLTKRFIKMLNNMAKKDPEKFEKFWKNFGIYIKEGITTDFAHKDALSKLLKFESSSTEAGKHTSLPEYVERMQAEQKEIYFLVGASRKAMESGPYLEAFKSRNIEVLFLYEAADEFIMSSLGKFDDKKLTSIDQGDLDLGNATDEANLPEALEEKALDDLLKWVEETLGKEKVSKVSVGKRLTGSPAIALNTDKMMSANMRRMMQMMNPDAPEMPTIVEFQINPRHTIIKNLSSLKNTNPDKAKLITEQLFDGTMMTAGLLEDPFSMLTRMNKILEEASIVD